MSSNERSIHFVCTREEGQKLVQKHARFWVCNCGCREGRGYCGRSRIDLCLMFRDDISPTGSNMHEIPFTEVERIFEEAKEKHLVVRPFRDDETRQQVEGICFCCDDCCGYFLNSEEKCDKGPMVEMTDMADCTHCGICVEVCYFDARRMAGNKLVVENEKCFGCGLCVEVCPEECIHMHLRLIQWI